MNKQGYEVMCRVESMSIRDALSIPESFSAVSEPFNEVKLIRLDIECPSEVRALFLQTIFKPKQFSESLSLPMNVSIMLIEAQWVCFPLSRVLVLDNEKYVVEAMLSFLLTFFMSESILSVHINFDHFIADNIHKKLVNFSSLRNFIYYTYTLKIFIETNKR